MIIVELRGCAFAVVKPRAFGAPHGFRGLTALLAQPVVRGRPWRNAIR